MTPDANPLARPLEGQVAWVTGSSRGLGRVIATRLAALGAKVAVHGSSATSARAFGEADSLQSVADDIAATTGADVRAWPGDLTDAPTVTGLVEAITACWGGIDLVVANAGGDIGVAGTSGPKGGKPAVNDTLGIALDDVRAVLDRNLLSCVLTCQAVVPGMMARGRGGRVITIGSVAGLVGRVEGAIYGVAKAAVHHYTRCLAAQLRPHNIPVNCIAPGGTMTPRFVATGQAVGDQADRVGTLAGYGQPDDIAAMVAFLAGEGGRHISGQVLRVDGGGQLFPA